MSGNTPPGDPNQPIGPGPSGPPPAYLPPAGQASRGPVEHLQQGQGQPLAADPRRGNGRRATIIGGLALTGALVAGGVWAWTAWFSQGPQPAEALPASTLAYASIDLDPSGSQKVEAITFLRKFPAFQDEVGLDTDDDVRKEIFTRIQDEGACEGLDYADDIEPWLGDRFAFAVIDRGDDGPAPVLVAQIKDEDKAADGLDKLVECGSQVAGESEDIGGYAFNGDWVVLAETEDIAKDVVTDAEDKALSEDAAYTKWTEASGDPGIMTLYASPKAGEALVEFMGGAPLGYFGYGSYGSYGSDEGYGYSEASPNAESPPKPADPGDFPTASPGAHAPGAQPTEQPSWLGADPSDFPIEMPSDLVTHTPKEAPSPLETQPVEPGAEPETSSDPEPLPDETDPSMPDESGPAVPDDVREAFEDFPGGAGTLRFDDGNLELEFATGDLPGSWSSLIEGDQGADVLNTLPDTTAAALGVGFEEGWVDDLVDQLAPMIEGESGLSVDAAIEEFESETGLSVPEDIEALGGESFAIAFDSEFDNSAFEEEDITRVPVGAKIKGDPEKIEAALDKIRATAGSDGDMLLSRSEDGYVLVSASEAYLDKLADAGGLGDSSTLQALVPEADDASAILFVNFDADGWLDDLVESLDAPQDVVENVKPLEALGISNWQDGDESHSLVKLTTN